MNVPVEYQTLNGFFADYARNSSRAWTLIRTDKPLAVGSEITFDLVAPGLALQIRGTVEEVSGDGMRIGFFYRSPEERRQIDSMIKQMMLAELGPVLASQLLQGPASAR